MTNQLSEHDEEAEGTCLSLEQLTGYVERRLSAEEMATIESHLQRCPLCRDAVEGLSGYKGKQDFRDMLKEVRERIQAQEAPR